MIALLRVMQREASVITALLCIITSLFLGSIITHYYLFQSPELADDFAWQ